MKKTGFQVGLFLVLTNTDSMTITKNISYVLKQKIEQLPVMCIEKYYDIEVITYYLHFYCESLNEPLHLRCGSYLHEQIDLSHTHIRAI